MILLAKLCIGLCCKNLCVHFINCVHFSCPKYALKESSLWSSLKVKKLFAQNKHNIWHLTDCNKIWTHSDLVPKQLVNYLAKLPRWFSPNAIIKISEIELLACKGFLEISEYRSLQYTYATWQIHIVLITQLNHLVSLAKLLSVSVWTKLMWIRIT